MHATLAHQFIGQLDEVTRAAIFGNVGTIVAFRIGVQDAGLLSEEFHPLPREQLTDQFPFEAWIKRGVYLDQAPIRTLPLRAVARTSRDNALMASRRRFG